MSFGKIVLIGAFVLFGLPIIGIVLLQFGSAIFVWNVASIVNEAVDPAPVIKAGWRINERDARKPGLKALAEPAEMHRARFVEIRQIMSLAEMRGVDGTPVEPGAEDSYAAVRAPFLAREECTLIMSMFASECEVSFAETRKRSDGLYDVDIRLLYTPKQPFGTVRYDMPAAFLEVPADLNRPGHASPIPRAGQISARRGFYQEASAACARLRGQTGNCGLLGIRIASTASAPGTHLKVSGSATLGTLQAMPGS